VDGIAIAPDDRVRTRKAR